MQLRGVSENRKGKTQERMEKEVVDRVGIKKYLMRFESANDRKVRVGP